MEEVKKLFERKVVIVVCALIVGLALGLIYAWLISPLEWTDTEPNQLRHDLRVDYLRMVIDSYSVNQDRNLAKKRYEALGEDRSKILADVGLEPGKVSVGEIQNFKEVVAIVPVDEAGEETPISGEAEVTPTRSGPQLSRLLLPVCGATLLLGVLLGAAIIINRRSGMRAALAPREADIMEEETEAPPLETPDLPLATFRTTYSTGDDLYDDSFSIESASGDFLGECGVGIGEIIGVGEPRKVSAFEIWLFDKNDIQTVTKVLMSKYAFNDEATREQLSAKGDPVLAEGGSVVTLDTASLRVEARIVDMSYGESALPNESFFDRLTIELRAWPRSEG